MAEFRETGLDILSESLSKYIDSQNPQVREENRRANAVLQLRRNEIEGENKRANALLQLKRNELRQANIQSSKDNARADRLVTIKEDVDARTEYEHQEAIKEKEFKIAEDDFNIGWNDRINDNDISGALDWASSYKSSNPRLSKKIASLEQTLSGKNMILESNVNALENMLPGITDKLGGRNIVKSILFKEPTAIAKEMLISEVGKITGDNEKEFERQSKLIGLKLKQAEQMIDGPEKQAIMTSITADINKFTEKSGVNVDNLLDNVGDVGIDLGEKTESEYEATGLASVLPLVTEELGLAYDATSQALGFPSGKKAIAERIDKNIYQKNIKPALEKTNKYLKASSSVDKKTGKVSDSIIKKLEERSSFAKKEAVNAFKNIYGITQTGEPGFINEEAARVFKNKVPAKDQSKVIQMLNEYYIENSEDKGYSYLFPMNQPKKRISKPGRNIKKFRSKNWGRNPFVEQ